MLRSKRYIYKIKLDKTKIRLSTYIKKSIFYNLYIKILLYTLKKILL